MNLRYLPALLGLALVSQGATQSWSIANGRIERTLEFNDDSGLRTRRFADLTTHHEFVAPGGERRRLAPEFSFQCNGRSYRGAGSQFELLGSERGNKGNANSLTIRLRAKDAPIEVSVTYSVYEGQPAIRKYLTLRNTGSMAQRISHLNIEAIAPTVGAENETTLNTQYGTAPREIMYTGRSEDAALLVANGRTGIGFAVISEVPGYMKRTEISGWDEANSIPIGVLYDTDLMPFARSIPAGGEFQTAAVSLVTFRNGDGFQDPHWVLPSYAAKVLMRKLDGRGAPWIYNTWEPFERGINRDTVVKLIDAAARMGLDIFTIDDGWQQEYGDNAVNRAAFPEGLKPVQELIETKGMRLGLWIPLAAIGTETKDYKEHPEWAATDQDGQPKITGTAAGPKAVMCLASPFRDSAAARVNQAIEEFHLAYVKLDLTTIFNAYGESPGCWAKGHDHQSWAESLNMIYEGISYVTSKIYEKHPDVLLDLTFELWGQKHVIDAGLLAAGDLDWLSNVDDNHRDSAGPLQARTLLYQRAASMPVESMLIGNIHGELPTKEESFATEIGSAPLLLGDLTKLSAADQDWYHEKTAWFKKLRGNCRISESFFPLGHWRQPSAAEWDGFARLEHTGSGVLALFRNQSGVDSIDVLLPLMPEGKVRVRSALSNRELGVFTKADWLRGVKVKFASSERVEILELTAIQ